MPSSVVASRSRGIGIRVAAGFVLAIAAACGQSGSATPAATTVPGSAVATTAPTSSQAPSASPRPTITADPTGPPPAGLGSRLVATIDGIAKPCAMAATGAAIWVTGSGPARLARIDPASNEIVEQVSLNGSPCGIAVGPDGRLWIALLSVGQVIAVDPAASKVVATIDGLGTNLWDLKAGYGSIWVVDRTNRQLLRIDPSSATVADRLAIGPGGSGLAMAGGMVWVVDDADASVRRVDPATMSVTATFRLARGASWFANDADALLVANRLDGSITPVDVAAGTPGRMVDGAKGPLDGTVHDGRAYVPDGSARTLVEVDLASGAIVEVDRLEGAANPFVAEVAFGDVWVLDYGGKRIWRITP